MKKRWLQLTDWEYWPLWLANLPVGLFLLWFGLRARDLFFFSAVNPVIETGGLYGESKWGILQRVPASHLPPSIFVKKNTPLAAVLAHLRRAGLGFPLVAKPDVGERGRLVSKIKTETELRAYLAGPPVDFLLQKFIDLPVELAVVYHRLPGARAGQVSSICIKKMLSVTGDGRRTVGQLMAADPRASRQLPRFAAQWPELLAQIPARGEARLLEPIGNHCRGTMFLNANHAIDPALTRQFDRVARQMEGIHFGRFDLKCHSLEDLRKTGCFQVMEFNGVGAEAAHVYDPKLAIWKKYRDIYRHWRIIFRIYQKQRKRGLRGMSFREAWQRFQVYQKYQQQSATSG